MSGHSKWNSIKHQKGAADAKRGAVFTKHANAITIATKDGGSDAEFNFSLRIAIEKARSDNMPKDRIEKAIKRGTGELGGEQLVEAIYEGFGPHQVAFIIEAVTDNKNRTVADIKHLFSKSNCTLGGPNSVAWMFKRYGILRFENEGLLDKKDDFELTAIDAGAVDIIEYPEGLVVYTNVPDFQKIREALETAGFNASYSEIGYIPKERVVLSEEQVKSIEAFTDKLDEISDVKDYYTNAD